MTTKFKMGVLAVAAMLVLAPYVAVHAQNTPQAGTNPVQATQSLYYTTAISATAAVNTATTLTIPAPAAGLYNYVCSLSFEVSNDNTGTAVSDVVSTNTNFGTFAVKFSQVATASLDSYVSLISGLAPATGCVKSTSAATATTFVSPANVAHATWTWYATYAQMP